MILNRETFFGKNKSKTTEKIRFRILLIYLKNQSRQNMKKILLVSVGIIVFIIICFLMWNHMGSVPDFMHPTVKYALWAFAIGALVTISLPLGAMSGLAFKPGPKMTAIFTAFGGGALMAALSVELIAPTVEEEGVIDGIEKFVLQ